MAFGDKVRQLRKARRLTQSDLAKALSLSQRAISELESGKTQPKQDAIRRIAEILRPNGAVVVGRVRPYQEHGEFSTIVQDLDRELIGTVVPPP